MKHMYHSTDSEGVVCMVYLSVPSPGIEAPVLVTHIWTRKDARGHGHASELFNEVLKQADDEGVRMMLSIDPDPGGLLYTQLYNWYVRCGFHYFLDPDGDWQDPTMIRYPGAERVYDTQTTNTQEKSRCTTYDPD